MKLYELEQKLKVKFPCKWWDIYNTGAMEWLECSEDEFKNKRESYISDPNSFLMLSCDCEPLLFYKISEKIDDLNEWISWAEEDEELFLKENIKLIPFGESGAGDLYCFLYRTDRSSEPEVILYLHDEYDNHDIIGKDFDEFIYVMLLDAAANGEDTAGKHWNSHMKFLSHDYFSIIKEKSADELKEIYENKEFEHAEILENSELESGALSYNNRDYILKVNICKPENYRTIIFKNLRYQVVGWYENEEQLIALNEKGNVYLLITWNNDVYYVATSLEAFKQELLVFEKLTKECKLIDKISVDNEDTSDILDEISGILKNDIIKIDTKAFDNIENFWAEICDEIEAGVIFM